VIFTSFYHCVISIDIYLDFLFYFYFFRKFDGSVFFFLAAKHYIWLA